MKRRLTILALAMVMLVSWMLPASAAAYYEDLWGKYHLQIESGSGFKATLTGETQGNSLLAEKGLSLSGLAGEVSLICDQVNPETYQVALDLAKGEKELAEIMIYGDDKAAALQAGFLTGAVQLPLAEIKDLVLSKDRDYEWISALYTWATCEDEIWLAQMKTAGEAYQLDFEMWLAEYAQISTTVTDGAMTIAYTIPAADIKAEMQRLLVQLMGDENMLAVLGQLLTSEQAYRYLNPQWLSQYLNLLENIALEGTVEVQHTQSMKGEVLSTRVVMPIPDHLGLAYKTFTVESDDAHWYFGLTGEDSITLRWDKQLEGEKSKGSGLLAIDQGDVKAEAEFAFAQETKSWRDEENYENLTNQWSLTASNAKAGQEGYLAFEPLTLVYTDTLRSGPDRRNSTHVDVKMTLKSGEGTDSLHLAGKTTSPWTLVETDLASAESVTAMNEGQRMELLTAILSGLSQWVTN
ncbi:MAG: hypothetical protein IJ461_05730 [Clostridia bacterium]|nr:hypothetical protein [Clostridia bacterium]